MRNVLASFLALLCLALPGVCGAAALHAVFEVFGGDPTTPLLSLTDTVDIQGFEDNGNAALGDTGSVGAFAVSIDLGCDAGRMLSFSSAFRGNLIITERGTCAFATKVLNAEAAGAVGVVVYNNAPELNAGLLIDPTGIPAALISGAAISAIDQVLQSSQPPFSFHLGVSRDLPEPSSFGLLLAALAGIWFSGRSASRA
jgi:PA domain